MMRKAFCLSTDELCCDRSDRSKKTREMIPEIKIPAEWEPHAFCYMAWAVHREWGADVDNVKRELREVISTVAEYEPVRLLVPPDLINEAQCLNFGQNVEVLPAPVDDIWMRDILPTFALRDGAPIAIDWNFNGWGSTSLRPPRSGDRLAGAIASITGLPTVCVPFVAEGGAFVTDGYGTIVTTKSCLLNPNRNSAIAGETDACMARIEHGLWSVGGRNVVWLEGDRNEPITSGHADGYVLFAPSRTVLVEGIDTGLRSNNRRAADIHILTTMTDTRMSLFRVAEVLPPRQRFWRFSGSLFAPCYLNAHVANGAVITAIFGDPERDEAARNALQSAFPEERFVC
ncbi:agmatine deiminase family protein [Bradyrhizobium sp. DN5]|uniref:agmatine deiminase family protein n=1 Tax=Bradyrhizobium sp. DN5 TaxID=3056950 RepID=UPI0035267CAD